jgi:hypothetical protein
VVFVNGECIHYYQKFDAAKLSTAIPWTANTAIPLNTLIVLNSNVYLTTGNVYAMSNVSVNAANIQLVKLNSLTQIRRGVDGTGVPNVHLANSQVVDSSLAQFIPDAQIYSAANITGNVTTTSNVTYKVTLSAPITANIGDYLTQFANTGNARILSNITNANVVAVDFVTGTFQLASNIATRVNLVSLTNGLSSSNANVVTAGTLGTIYANGNVVLSSTLVLRSNIWEQLGTTLENSTTVPAQFIRAEPSYIP